MHRIPEGRINLDFTFHKRQNVTVLLALENTTMTATAQDIVAETAPAKEIGFVAINYISCKPHYRDRFEELFSTRAHAIDRREGFIRMHVLRPKKEDEPYLIVSHWASEDAFKGWLDSPEFLEGHKRGFEDIKIARERGEEPPMTSSFQTYEVVCH